LAEKSSWDRQTDGKKLVWFGEIKRKLAKLSMTTFAYRSSSELFYVLTVKWRENENRAKKVLIVRSSFYREILQRGDFFESQP
jgi:hypothetical protein